MFKILTISLALLITFAAPAVRAFAQPTNQVNYNGCLGDANGAKDLSLFIKTCERGAAEFKKLANDKSFSPDMRDSFDRIAALAIWQKGYAEHKIGQKSKSRKDLTEARDILNALLLRTPEGENKEKIRAVRDIISKDLTSQAQ